LPRRCAGARRLAAAEATWATFSRRSSTIGHRLGIAWNSAERGLMLDLMTLMGLARAQRVSANSSRPISMRRISLVPAPIS
jgi:hypothetical protein